MIKRVLIPVLLILLGFGAFAQSPPEVNTLVLPSFDSVPAGGSFDLCVQFQVPEKYHLTENFLEVRLGEIEGFSTSFQQITSGEFEKGEIVRRGTVIMKLPVEVSDTIGTGTYTLKVTTSYQICREVQPETCFPPKDVDFSISITVLETGADPIANTVGKSLADKFTSQDALSAENLSDELVKLSLVQKLAQKLKKALAQGSVLAFLLVFVAGFLTSLTPCVYPMIPITISYIGGRSTGHGKFRGFILSLFYVLGLALVYALLGVVAALTGSLFGSITQIPAVIGGVALIFGIMGLSMLGLFDIQLPSSFQSRMQSGGPKSGFLGAVVMGAVAGLVAAPCAGPVIVALMTYIASTGKVIFGFTLMMSFAAGMGVLFIVLGTFSGLLSALPSAGMWMAKVKKTFGVIMIGAAVFIAKPILPPPVFGILTGIGIVLLGAAMGAFRPIEKDDEYKKDMLKGCALILVFWGIYSIVILLPVPGRIIPDQVVSGTAFQGPVETDFWRSNLKEALSEAKLSEKMLIVDFGAEWCRACKELDHKTFSDATVIARLKEMIAVKVDCTKSRDPKIKALQREYKVTGLPTIIILDSGGIELGRFVSFIPPDQFLEFLDQTIQSAKDVL